MHSLYRKDDSPGITRTGMISTETSISTIVTAVGYKLKDTFQSKTEDQP